MARPKEDQKPEVMQAIAAHLSIHGTSNYSELFEKFPKVSRATFFRWIKEAKDKFEENASEHGTLALQLAQKRIRSNVELTPENSQRQIKAQLPVAPSPAVIAALPPAAVQQTFNFLSFFYEIVYDVKLLRDMAVKAKNPMLLEKVVGKRIDILDTWMKSQEFMFNLEQMEKLFTVVIEEVGKVSPEAQAAILVRLRAANSVHGFTASANLN
jgi:transposase-like protein